jgi:hypothetical protein
VLKHRSPPQNEFSRKSRVAVAIVRCSALTEY